MQNVIKIISSILLLGTLQAYAYSENAIKDNERYAPYPPGYQSKSIIDDDFSDGLRKWTFTDISRQNLSYN